MMEPIPPNTVAGFDGESRNSSRSLGEIVHLLTIMSLASVAMIVIGTALGFACGGFRYYSQLQAVPEYEAIRSLLVIVPSTDEKSELLRTPFDPVMLRDARTHAQLIKSPLIVVRAIQKAELDKLTSLKGVPRHELVKFVSTQLVTDFRRQDPSAPAIFEVRYRAATESDATSVLNAVVESYKEFLLGSTQSITDDTVRLMTEAKDELSAELKRKRDELRKFSREAPVDLGDQNSSLKRETKTRFETELAEIAIRRAKLTGAVTVIEGAQQEGKSPEAILSLIADVVEVAAGVGKRAAEEPSVAKTIEKFRLDLKRLDEEQKTLELNVQKAEKELAYLNDLQMQSKILADEIRSTEQLNQLVLDRFKQIDFVRGAATVRLLVVEPAEAVYRVVPNLVMLLMVGALWGAALGAVFAICVLPIYGLVRLRK